MYYLKIDDLNKLPRWHNDELYYNDEGEDWKPNPTRDLCKAMYEQWNQVMIVLKDFKGIMLSDAYHVGAKIRSSEAGLYIIRMENAAIKRRNS